MQTFKSSITNTSETLAKILEMRLKTENLMQLEFAKRIKTSLLLHKHLLLHPLVTIKNIIKDVCAISSESENKLVTFL
jgi:hypothetical protein